MEAIKMNESRVFMLNGTEVSQIVTRLENFFRTEKGMEVQSSQTTDGYVMQLSLIHISGPRD